MKPLSALNPGPMPAATTTAALKAIGLLAILVFLVCYTYEVLLFNHLYEPQQFLLVLLQLALGLWAGVEWGVLHKRATMLPLRGLGLALGIQWLLGLSRYPLNQWLERGQAPTARLFLPEDLSLALLFVPLHLVILLLIGKQIIDALAFMERERAALLQRETETRWRAEEALNRSLRARQEAESQVITLRGQLERTAFELTENIPVGTYTMVLSPGSTLARFSFMSRRFLDLTGLDREVAASDPLKAFACVHPDDYAAWVQLNAEVFARKAPFFGQCRIIFKGAVRWITAESIPRELPDGTWIWEGVLVDITAQKEAGAALRQAHQDLLVAERKQARQVERQRLLRDMHDGFGSQLATARIRMSQDQLSPTEGAAVLDECLADLHLLVDTLGNTERSLARALADYRYRCQQRLSQGPAQVRWHLSLADCPLLPERTLLQLLRMLQEGLTNALKHAQASQILIEARYESAGRIELSVTDDGIGLPADIPYGRGLGHMESRARDIGAHLIFERLDPGTRLRLSLPLGHPKQDATRASGSRVPMNGLKVHGIMKMDDKSVDYPWPHEEPCGAGEPLVRRPGADLQADYDQVPVGLFALDTELRFQRINAYLAGLNGQPAAAHLGRTIREMVPGLADQVEPLLRHVLRTGEPALNVEFSGDVTHPASGQRVWRVYYHPLRSTGGEIIGITGMVEEVTALKQAERELRASEQRYRELSADLERQVAARTAEIRAADTALRESEARYRTIYDSVVDAIFILDLDGNILAVNAHACQRYGYTREEFLRLHITAIDTPEDAVNASARIAAVDRDGQVTFEAHHRDAQGRPLMVEARASKILYNDRPAMLAVVRDITERQRAQERAEYLAYHDPLTGLPNRVRGLDRLAQMVAQARRHRRQLAVMYLDLDQFKHVNDHHGHLLGDRLLQSVSQRLSQQVRAEDSLCRLAGDEFMLVLAEVSKAQSLADLASLCDRLLDSMAKPFDLDGQQVHVNLSLGVALYPRDGSDDETLMRNADTALNVAKRAGRQTYRFFEPRMNEELARFILTRDALRLALERHEFVLHYQPRVALDSGRVVGVEALVRWQRPGVGLVMPGDFIDVAEESGLIIPLGRWVLAEACRQAVAWRQAGWPDLVMAVNLSTVQFRRGGIGTEVLAALDASGLPAAGLELELTESILLEGAEDVLATVSTWKAAGIQLAIDDFGTGYSSLAYLKRFQVDKLKIDRSFINGMAEHDQDRSIVQAIIDLAAALDLHTIAEGVEDATQASQLQFMGCDEAQGYLYARPLAAADLEHWWRGREGC